MRTTKESNMDPTTDLLEPLLRTHEAARLLGWTSATLRQKRSKGAAPPAIRLGRAVRYYPSAIRDWIKDQQNEVIR